MRILTAVLLPGLAVGLSACSDPETEEPVSPRPGLYRIAMDRSALGPTRIPYGPKKVEQACVGAGEELEWLYPMIERKFCPECSCSTEDRIRTGNVIAARAVCPHDDSGTFGALEYAYRGVVSEQGVTLEGKIKSGLATALPPDATEAQKEEAAEVEKAWDSVVMSARVERVGDCPG